MMTLGMPWRLGRPLVRGRLTKMSPFLFQTEYQPDCDHSTSAAFLEPVERTGSHLSKKTLQTDPSVGKKKLSKFKIRPLLAAVTAARDNTSKGREGRAMFSGCYSIFKDLNHWAMIVPFDVF